MEPKETAVIGFVNEYAEKGSEPTAMIEHWKYLLVLEAFKILQRENSRLEKELDSKKEYK